MCGIAGFIGFNDNYSIAKESGVIQKHRGPDNQSVWSDDYIAMAHQRLSIIDLNARSDQPFQKHHLVIIYNGELYNYKEIRDNLIAEKNAVFFTESDTEVILEAYYHYGEKCLDWFVGMFAFAIYNKNDKTLFIARDHFGIKPLFYTLIGNGFAFSSELKTLVRINGFNKSINSKALVSCLNYLWIPGNETMFNNCYKLPPAHYLTYINGEVKIEQYWQLDDKIRNTANENEIVRELSVTLKDTVLRHMVADVPVSAFLSGGLDSSLISVLAKSRNESLSTYTIGTLLKDKKLEQMPDDEKYANIVAERFGFDHNVIRIDADILNELPHIVYTLDEPIGDPAAINTYLICKAAREKGVKVLLSGMGADEIFFGYRRQMATLMALRYNKLPLAVKKAAQFVAEKMPVKIWGRGFKIGRWAKRFLSFANMPVDEAYMRSYSYYDSKELKELVKEEHVHAIDKIRQEHKDLFYSKYNGDIINQMCHVDTHMFMQGLNLTYSDRASMAASVEVRVPFIDKIVIEKAMQIPGHMKIKKGISKYILKKAAEEFLPEEIIYRPKASFGAPLRSWISSDLKNMVDDLLCEESINKRGLLNYSFVKRLIDKDRKGEEDYAYQVYQLLTLELWCRAFLDN